jgi:capsular polysaccharide biosynthesis protein
VVHALEEVLVNREALMFRRGRIYPESFVARLYAAHYRRPSRYGAFLLKNYWLRRGAVRVPSGLWVIDNFSAGSYHHWLVDVLSRLVLARKLYHCERVLLLPRHYRNQPYVPFTLQGFPEIHRVGWIGARAKVRVGRLAFVPRPPIYLGELITEVAERVGRIGGEPGGARHIYLSRSDAQRRRARNEAEVVRVLRSYDFEILRIDPNKPWEQVRASRGAKVIVGVHGAALTNLIFMPPGGRLLELRHGHDEVFFHAYAPLAAATGVAYHDQRCDLAEGAVGWEINNADLIVDLDKLRENLRLVLRDT